MLSIALELAVWSDPSYEDMASKFFEHFVEISDAMNHKGLWDEEDGFYYDQLRYVGWYCNYFVDDLLAILFSHMRRNSL